MHTEQQTYPLLQPAASTNWGRGPIKLRGAKPRPPHQKNDRPASEGTSVHPRDRRQSRVALEYRLMYGAP
eukprot:1381404-Prymnesium_polylepis.1